MVLSDSLIAIIAVLGFVLIIYSAQRRQSITDTIREIKDLFAEKGEEVTASSIGGLKYAN